MGKVFQQQHALLGNPFFDWVYPWIIAPYASLLFWWSMTTIESLNYFRHNLPHQWKISGCVLQLTGEHRPELAEVMKLERRRGGKTWYQWKFQSMTLTINKIRTHKGGNVTLSWKYGALNIAKSLFCVRQRLFFFCPHLFLRDVFSAVR